MPAALKAPPSAPIQAAEAACLTAAIRSPPGRDGRSSTPSNHNYLDQINVPCLCGRHVDALQQGLGIGRLQRAAVGVAGLILGEGVARETATCSNSNVAENGMCTTCTGSSHGIEGKDCEEIGDIGLNPKLTLG